MSLLFVATVAQVKTIVTAMATQPSASRNWLHGRAGQAMVTVKLLLANQDIQGAGVVSSS
jgi:hypothetical protein